MKTSFFLKASVITLAFSATFVGINLTRAKTLSNNPLKTHLSKISLGAQSMAYCNAEAPNETWEKGVCIGDFNGPQSRCVKESSSNVSIQCYAHPDY